MTVRIGLVGLGYWGPNLARVFNELSDAELVICCDLEETNLEKVAYLYPKIETTHDVKILFEDGSLDAIVVATSAATHYELAKKALTQGKHVFIEKPLSLEYNQGQELVEIAERKNKVLMVGHLLEYHPAVNTIKNYLIDGLIGQVYYLYSQRLNLGKIRKDENCLWSLAPHDISAMLYLIESEPTEVSAIGASYLRKGIDDVVFVNLVFANRIVANIHISWLDPRKTRTLTIVGDDKMIVFDDMESSEKIRIYDRGVDIRPDYKAYGEDLTLRFGDIIIPSFQMKEPLKIECRHFIDCIRENKVPRSDGRDGLRVLKVLKAAQESIDKGGVPIKLKG